ncbi:MAG: polysaccharide biosynthesis C-terminal domain-containing protein, partial [Saprospiraceae bacterium]|nr:polysaccharide biosynthesis C-terminal domain-containing protein [Saprospiraceae bacterium]
LGILMVSFISMTLGYVSGCYLTASGKVNNLIRSFILAILINVLLNLILIPHFKVMGVAITSAITQFFILVVQVNRSKHYAGFKFQNQFILNFLMFLTTFVAVSLLVEKFLTINWYYQLIITPIFGLLLAWLFKIIPDEILLAIKERKFFIQR